MTYKKWIPLLFLVTTLFQSGCGESGGGNTGAPAEIASVLSEDPSNNNNGYIVEYGLNSGTGIFQPSGSSPLSTGGSTPFQILFSPNDHWAFVLNNNNSSDTAPHPGSVSIFSVSSNGLSSTIGGPQPTGQNPVNMAIDPGGTYLVVANHGNGSETGGVGSVGVISYNSSGQLSPMTTSTPCTYPFRVVFQPNSTGSPNDTVDVVCSSPELLGSTSPPPIQIYACSISDLERTNGCANTQSIPLPTNSSNNSAMLNFAFDPSGTYAVGPSVTNASDGFLIVCTLSSSLTCNNSNGIQYIASSHANSWIPSGNISFLNGGTSPTVYIGNYFPNNSSGFTSGNMFAPCTISSSATTCTPTSYTSANSGKDGPIYLATQGNHLYIISTVTPIPGAYNGSSTTTSSNPPAGGFLFSCPIPFSTSNCSTPENTGYWPVGISFDQNANHLFVPTLSGAINVYSGASTGTLSPFQTLTDQYTPISVIVH
ncbi:MAG: beta-propeller fold lactonase family protein [Leptospirales bacterium]